MRSHIPAHGRAAPFWSEQLGNSKVKPLRACAEPNRARASTPINYHFPFSSSALSPVLSSCGVLAFPLSPSGPFSVSLVPFPAPARAVLCASYSLAVLETFSFPASPGAVQKGRHKRQPRLRAFERKVNLSHNHSHTHTHTESQAR